MNGRRAQSIEAGPVHEFLAGLQDRICAALEQTDGQARFLARVLENERGGVARPRVLSDGPVIERAAVNFSHSHGSTLPPAATERRPELAGCPFEAVSLSLIVHPRNPYAPTTHANFRFFCAQASEPAWWFGGGFDLTPYYGFEEDARHWHEQARDAVEPFGEGLYARFKKSCDEYFFLPHRNEARGIGGLFVDDYAEGSFEEAFAMTRSMAEHFLPAYLPILERRKDTVFGEREREFQKLRRGRYVEFNLIYDRGTRFGLQASSRTESILASLPPEVSWRYDWTPEPGSEEARLYEEFLPARDWLAGT